MKDFRQVEYARGFALGLACLEMHGELLDIALCAKPFRVGYLDAFYEKPSCNPWGNQDAEAS